MNLLLVILFLVGAPMPPPPAPLLVIAPPSQTITLTWDNSPTVGTSNRLYYWQQAAQTDFTLSMFTNYVWVTNAFDVGTTNLCRVSVDSTRRYFAVRAVLDGIESVPSNVVKFPGDTLREFFAVKPDGQKVVLGMTTNTPPGASGFYRVNYQQWETYE